MHGGAGKRHLLDLGILVAVGKAWRRGLEVCFQGSSLATMVVDNNPLVIFDYFNSANATSRRGIDRWLLRLPLRFSLQGFKMAADGCEMSLSFYPLARNDVTSHSPAVENRTPHFHGEKCGSSRSGFRSCHFPLLAQAWGDTSNEGSLFHRATAG